MKRKILQRMMTLAAFCTLAAGAAARAADKDIVETAVGAGSFKTLAAALDAASLVDALKGKGPFTVFAPTDAAFAKLPAGTVESLLKPANKDQLAAVLSYHVVAEQLPAAKVTGQSGAVTLNGQRIDFAAEDGQVTVDRATVVKADIHCSNGIIHVIDRVLLPATDNLVETAKKAGGFNTLLAAAKAAGLAETLARKGPFTVFAPTDKAFAKLPEGTVASLLKPENRGKLAAILKYHVVSGRVYSNAVVSKGQLPTLHGGKVHVTTKDGQVKVDEAEITRVDVDAANGVLHVIDRVLLPPKDRKVGAAEARAMIEHAVARGARTFNAGDHSACAELYLDTMRQLVGQGDSMPASLRDSMKQVIVRAEHISCPTQRSWTLRHGLDHAYARMALLK